MTLANMLRQKLAESPAASGRQDVMAHHAGESWSVTLTLDHRDAVGCLVWELILQRADPEPVGETLSTWAERIARKTTGLLEPLQVVEIDLQRNEGFLRSANPAVHIDQVQYYEVFLKGARQATVRRYQAPVGKNGPRAQASFALTHESLLKLVEDVTAPR